MYADVPSEQAGSGFDAFEAALIRSCYRVLLQREPEPEALAGDRAPPLPPDQEERIRARLADFVASHEFREKMRTPQGGAYDGSLFKMSDLLDLPRADVVNELRKRCQTTYLGDSTALCRVLGRFHMFVQTTDHGFGVHVMHTGAWEMPFTEFVARTVKPGMRVLDVGANFGYYSLLMSELVGHRGRCFAFEPNVAIAELLQQSLSVNGFQRRSQVFELALTDAARGPMQFFIPHAEPKNARLQAEVPEWLLTQGRCVEVPTGSLDELSGELGSVDFIKIDAEGAELDILKGARRLLESQRPDLVVEVNCGRGYDVTPTLTELTDLYGGLRYVTEAGYAQGVDLDTVRKTRVGEDWMLYFSRR
jgi:FkbM family methyltransferase